jgi:Photoprotection regulator fluorescence recovery protein
MTILPPSADQDFYSTMRELKWSSKEKAIARRCFDRSLQQELDAAIQSTKEMAARIRQASELWELEHHLTQVRKEIDRKYEYKYSTLMLLFADLVREGKLDREDLRGLSEDKFRYIRRHAGQSAA